MNNEHAIYHFITSHMYKSESLGLVSVINKTHTSPPVGVLPLGAVESKIVNFIHAQMNLVKLPHFTSA